jgi:hypothetical protein
MRFSKELVRNGAPVRARCCGTGFAALHESGYGRFCCRSRRRGKAGWRRARSLACHSLRESGGWGLRQRLPTL